MSNNNEFTEYKKLKGPSNQFNIVLGVLGVLFAISVIYFYFNKKEVKTDQESNKTVDCSNNGAYASGYSSGKLCRAMGDYSSCQSYVSKYNYQTGRDILVASDCYCEGFNDGKNGNPEKEVNSDSYKANLNSDNIYSSSKDYSDEKMQTNYGIQNQSVSVPEEINSATNYNSDALNVSALDISVLKKSIAILPNKMNVFYIGVDNPVTIYTNTSWDQTSITIEGGTIEGSGSERIVKVSTVGRASITITTMGEATTFQFRVKRLPNPIFKIGRGGSMMPFVEFQDQQFCRVEMENFDFDVKFELIKADVYFCGSNFPTIEKASIITNNLVELSSLIQKCGPGSVIIFDNIRVQGPDGSRSIESKSILLY